MKNVKNNSQFSILNSQFGFTLIELLAVIAIIGILATVVLVTLNSVRAKSRDARRIADLDSLRTAFEMYYEDYKYYPSQSGSGSEDCDCSSVAHYIGGDADCLSGCAEFKKYLNPVPTDPLLGKPNPKANDRPFYYIYWSSKQGIVDSVEGQGFTVLATTENPHPNEGYKWDPVYPWAQRTFGDYYYAVAGGSP